MEVVFNLQKKERGCLPYFSSFVQNKVEYQNQFHRLPGTALIVIVEGSGVVFLPIIISP
jgi:hypothetical protein